MTRGPWWLFFSALLVGVPSFAQDEWLTAAAPMPTARKEINNATVTLNGEVFVVGGIDSDGRITGALESYDPSVDRWHIRAPLPEPVWRTSAAAVAGRLYVFGGYTAKGAFPFAPTAKCWVYDPATDRWQRIADLPNARGSLVALSARGRVHVIGGATNLPLATHTIYDPSTDQWEAGPPLPTARSGLSGAALGDHLHIVGGYILSGGAVLPRAEHEVYSLSNGSWTTARGLPRGRFGLASVSFARRLITFGGSSGGPGLATTLEYDQSLDEWVERAPMPSPAAFLGAASVDNRVLVLGGGRVNLNRFDAMAMNRTYVPVDAGIGINAGLGGSWINPGTPGQGFLIEILPATDTLFLAWFTYATVEESDGRKLGSAGQRWLTAQGAIQQGRAELVVTNTSRGVFADDSPVEQVRVGTAAIEFETCTSGHFEYALDNGLVGQFDIVRLAPDTLCAELASGR